MQQRLAKSSGLAAVSILGLGVLAQAQVSGKTPRYFPFVMPLLDTTPSIVSMAGLNAEPAGAAGRAVIRDGHFVDAHGDRLRLLGSNLTFGGAFPPKDVAARIAGRMRKLGLNVIRFHHIDTGPAPRGVWLRDFSGLDPEQMDKLDWLVFQLKEHGIYTNLNLHVSRTYPGIPKDTPRTFRYGKGLDNFHRPFIELQKDYARLLLTHRNAYTGTTYAEDPTVIVIELNNENALTNVGWEALAAMPDSFRNDLKEQWLSWLRERYADTAALRARWNKGSEPLGEELLSNTDYTDGLTRWTLEQGGGARMDAAPVPDSGTQCGRAVEMTTRQPGAQPWNLQFHQTGLNLVDGKTYTLSFRIRADEPRAVGIAVRLDQAPWRMCGLNRSVNADSEWKHFSFTFQCRDPEPDHCRASFNFNNQIGKFRIGDVSLRPGGIIGLPQNCSLEDGTIPLALTSASKEQRADFHRFLSETECRYVAEMVNYLKRDLGVRAAVCCSQVSYGGICGMLREGTLSDFLDSHAYWQHPHFPGKPWDGNNWRIPNTSMVAAKDGGTLGSRAWYRMAGKPYTVSEYDHPAPNDYAAELFPMLASFAAFQDWDGIYQFTYHSRWEDIDTPKIGNYFELCAHPGKLAFLPIAAVMFRMQAVSAGQDSLVVPVPTGDVWSELATHGTSFKPAAELGTLALVRPVAFALTDADGPVQTPTEELPPERRVSDTGQITWDVSTEGREVYTVNAPAVRIAVGYIGNRELRLGDVVIHVTEAEDEWAAIGIAALDGKPLVESEKVLIAAVGRVENTNMGWNEERTSVGRMWGTAPTVAEGIKARISLPFNRQVHALDGTGKRTHQLHPVSHEQGIDIDISPEFRTLWYAVTR